MARSGDRMVSVAGVRAQAGLTSVGAACSSHVEDAADNAADLEL